MNLSTIFLLARRDLGAYLRTWTGYIIIACVLFADALLFHTLAIGGSEAKRLSADVLREFFFNASGVSMIASAFISMRLVAEERQLGTITLLYASPVRDAEIVLGKYLAALGFLAVLTLCTAFLPAMIFIHGKVSVGHIVAGYLGLLLLGAAALSVGTFASALVKSPILAVVISGAMILSLVLAWMIARVTDRPLSDVFTALALHGGHFQPFMVGIVALRNVVYYLAVTYVFLFAATRVVEARRWR